MKKLLFFLIFFCAQSVFAADKTLTFTWNQVLSDDLAGFTLYEYDSAGTLTGDTFNIPYSADMSLEHSEVIAVPDNQSTTLCYDLTASDNSGNESEHSNRACVNIDFESPAIPVSLTITIQVVTE